MHGIQDPVIRERSWCAEREITAEQLAKDLAYAEDIRFGVHEVHFDAPDGKPVVVVWVAGARAGQLFSAYEITERESASEAEAWAYSHTGWSAHSGGSGTRTYWLACYSAGRQVGTHDTAQGRLVRFKSYDAARRRAKQLNRELGITD